MSLALSIVVPGVAPLERQAESVTLPGLLGQFTVLPNHAPLLAQLKPGLVEVRAGGQAEVVAVGPGVCEVIGDSVRVLAGKIAEAESATVEAANQARELGETALRELAGPADGGWQDAQDALAWAEALSSLAGAEASS